MDTTRLEEITIELDDIKDQIDACPESNTKKIYNLVKRRERLVMEKDSLLLNNSKWQKRS